MVGVWVGVLAVAIVLLVVVVAVTFTLLRRYRLRRLQELRGRGEDPTLSSDRAYNRLALARREADVLGAQGVDVTNAQQLIDLANRSLDARDFGRAYDLAQSAHETLVKARRSPLRSAPPPPATDPGSPMPAVASGTAPSTPVTPAPAPTPVPKNRAEAQFQLKLFEEDLVHAKSRGAAGPDAEGARELYVQAHAAFSRGEYADAFRLALRGRRRIGGTIEALAPSSPGVAPSEAGTDAAETAEAVAASGRCAQCGHPTVAGDTYCRGCGAAIAGTACPKCGAARTPRDTFCGKCGTRYG